ncbi:hypothetical protein SODALDRAFT_327481 [Sodiomyces alkalinus F11]|uniref:Uncharacterized protein n=1 Tax=Sodiomyces alkalinus (strain CBS 110278 / VKM F-3762 / F11) TaxID=1314773 RepID=A0A3N2Q965_SODAK|nr:hypothetical protein SODALDRAFT_327481 [Sodiomyces alkalinus F11]ROT43290.1 hypothetical protein SODALDRAFT_327481 [Sodiomyces alkalinus F11]
MNTPHPPKTVRFNTKKHIPTPEMPRSPPQNPLPPPKPALKRSISGSARRFTFNVFDRDAEPSGRQHSIRTLSTGRNRTPHEGSPLLRSIIMTALCFICVGLVIVSIIACVDWALRGAGKQGILPRFAWG